MPNLLQISLDNESSVCHNSHSLHLHTLCLCHIVPIPLALEPCNARAHSVNSWDTQGERRTAKTRFEPTGSVWVGGEIFYMYLIIHNNNYYIIVWEVSCRIAAALAASASSSILAFYYANIYFARRWRGMLAFSLHRGYILQVPGSFTFQNLYYYLLNITAI